MRTRAVLLAALLPCAAACAAPEKKTMTTPSLDWQSQNGGPVIRGSQAVYDEPSWRAAWRELGRPAPPLDFAKYAAAFVYVGERPTGGYGATFEPPEPRGDDLVVRYRIPKPTGMATQAFTRPWHVRAFPRPKRWLVIEEAR